MPNIYDVARRARTSVATVSAVVNESAYVSPDLHRRVRLAIRRLRYRPNLLARSLAKRRSHTIGMIVPNIANPFWPEVVRGAEDRAHAGGYTILLASSDDDATKEARYLALFLSKRVDGILLTKAPGALSKTIALEIVRSNTRLVNLARQAHDCPADAVLIDDRRSAYEAVVHLLRLGYRRIGMINGLGRVSTSRQRLAGFRQALDEGGLRTGPGMVVEGDFRVESGYTRGLALLDNRPDAVFIANYLMCVGFMRALSERRLGCPEDVAIVTCDDHPWLDTFTPRLTTINLPKYELGSEGAGLLIERIGDSGARQSRRVVLPSTLCVRESCGSHLRRVEPA
jgi:LacI family transcriptional regulator